MPRLVDPKELLELPLGVKIPVLPSSKPVFSRAKLGEKLHLPSCSFDLGDPYCRRLGTEYNSLHDPHLQEYHNRQRNIRRLKEGGYVTRDGRVVCTLKEFNEYRQYLTMLKLESEKRSRREEERLQQQLAKLWGMSKLPRATNASGLEERLPQPQKPSCPAPLKSRKVYEKLGPFRRLKAALEEGQTQSQPDLGQEGAKLPISVRSDTDSQRKPDGAPPAESVVKAEIEPQPAAEAQKLEELVEMVVQPTRPVARETLQNAFSGVQQRHAERRGNARTIVPQILGPVEKRLGEEKKPQAEALTNALSVRVTARRISETVLEPISQPGPESHLKGNFVRRVTQLPAPPDGKESSAAEGALPSVTLRFSRQPVPPEGPKPLSETGARRRTLRIKLVQRKPRQPM